MVKITTGETAPISGIYKYVGPAKKADFCNPTSEEMRIPLSKGEKAPPLKSCRIAGNWELDTKA